MIHIIDWRWALCVPILALACGPGVDPTPTPEAPTPTATASPSTPSPTPGPDLGGDLLISAYFSDTIHRADPVTGAPRGTLGPVPGAQSMRQSPGGDWAAVAEKTHEILRIDGVTGAQGTPFVSDDPATAEDESGGLKNPTAAVFGPDGDLYVASFSTSQVLRYDGEGAFKGVFVAAGAGELSGPDAGMIFGPEGDLYIPSYNNHRILRFDGETGAFEATLVDRADGLRNPRTLAFDGAGRLWVTSWGSGEVRRYTGEGAFIDAPILLRGPTGLALREDLGEVWVTSDQQGDVTRYDLETGADLGTLVSGADLGVEGATFLTWIP